MANKWISYVKKYALKHKIGYAQALKKAGPSYRKKYAKKKAKKRRKK